MIKITKSIILQYFQNYAQNHQSDECVSKNLSTLYLDILKATEKDILLGECPSCFRAYMKCNSTGVATCVYGGTETRRTVALDYVTDEYVFIDGHEGAGAKGLGLFILKQDDAPIECYTKNQMEKLAEKYGLKLHTQQFRDLNFYIKSHRLNRYNAVITEGPITFPIRPVFLSTITVEQPILLGYVYEMDDKEYFIVDFQDIDKPKKKKTVFSWWMLLGIIFPPVFLVALPVIIFRSIKD